MSDVGGGDIPTGNTTPQWSPDGSQIVWSGWLDTERVILTAGADGAGRVVVSDVDNGERVPRYNLNPEWSPEGDRIAWTGNNINARTLLFVANADGTDRRTVFEPPSVFGNRFYGPPQWRPRTDAGTRLCHCPETGSPFTDVSSESYAVDDVACIYNIGVTTGTSPTTYSLLDTVTREQMAAFVPGCGGR